MHSEKLGEVADEFDRVHSVHRALEVGALHHILPPANLRPYLIHAVERGMAKEELNPRKPHRQGMETIMHAAVAAAAGVSGTRRHDGRASAGTD